MQEKTTIFAKINTLKRQNQTKHTQALFAPAFGTFTVSPFGIITNLPKAKSHHFPETQNAQKS